MLSRELIPTSGRLYYRPETQWTQVASIAQPPLELARQLGQAQWKDACSNFNKQFRRYANPATVMMRLSGAGGGVKFELVQYVCECTPDWIHKPPSFYIFQPRTVRGHADFDGYLVVRARSPILCVEGHLVDYYMYGKITVRLVSIYPQLSDLGVVKVDLVLPMGDFRKVVRETLRLPANLELNILASNGHFIHSSLDQSSVCRYFESGKMPKVDQRMISICDVSESEPPRKLRRLNAQNF